MVDIASISAAIQGVKAAADIAQGIKNADISLEAAENKLEMANIISALADSKLALVNVQEELQIKNNEIIQLKDALKTKKNLVRHNQAHYEMDEQGRPFGDPYCSHCVELKAISVYLNQSSVNYQSSQCPSCRTLVVYQKKIPKQTETA